MQDGLFHGAPRRARRSPPSSSPGSDLLYGYPLDVLMTSFEHRFLPFGGMPVDVFGPEFKERCEAIAAKECAPRREDPRLLGYWLDNEAIWSPRGPGFDSLLTGALVRFSNASDPSPAGLNATLTWLSARYGGSIGKLNAAWHTEAASFQALPSEAPFPRTQARLQDDGGFLEHYAGVYSEVATGAIRSADPNHMVLGSRMNEVLEPLIRGQAPYTDAVDLHLYTESPSKSALELAHSASGGHPVLVSEFGFRSRDSGLPNTKGAGPIVDTQAERGTALRNYVTSLLLHPFVVGYHLFAWAEMPGAGNLFGADSNYGVVHLDGDRYAAYQAAFTEVNQQAKQLHAASGH